ncbi:MAG: F0F1 ATP synthase subunit beta, partial [Parcubacteria group bacterium QH_9_35_7]
MSEEVNKGTIQKIVGVVVDAHFPEKIPEVYNALEVEREDEENLVLEVQQHIGSNTVKAVAMDSTDGLSRGEEIVDTGEAISVP